MENDDHNLVNSAESTLCLACNLCLICPDGRNRCSKDFSIATGMCSSMEYGKAVILKQEYYTEVRKLVKRRAGKTRRK